MPVITGSANNQRPLAVTTGEYQTFDIDQNQDVRETIQMLMLNLSMKRRYLIEADQAYHGNTSHRMIGTEQFRRTFHHLRHFTDNWLKMIVDAYVARLVIQGFNIGDKQGNQKAWGLWRANGLDKYANLAHREAMKMGECYVMVDPTMTVKGYPRITVETPFQMIGWQDPTDRSKNVCALKYWQAADGYMYANLYDVDRVRKFRSPQSYYRWSEAGMLEHLPVAQSIPWAQYEEVGHELGVCPVFTIENQPTLTRGGVSDLEELIPLQRSIDVLLKNMMLASEYAAFPQKYAINVAIERDENGNPRIDQGLESAMSRFWAFPPPEKEGAPPVEVGAFPAVQVQNYVAAMEEIIHNMAMISSVPAYRLIGKLANMSASAIIAAEAGFTDCCRVKSTDYSTGWEPAVGTGLQVMGVEYEWMETLWKDPSAVNGPNVAASLVLLKEIGVPQRELFKMLGIGPQETEAWLAEADEEAKRAAEAEKKAGPKVDPAVLSAALTQIASNNSPNGNSSGDTDNNVTGNNLGGSETEDQN